MLELKRFRLDLNWISNIGFETNHVKEPVSPSLQWPAKPEWWWGVGLRQERQMPLSRLTNCVNPDKKTHSLLLHSRKFQNLAVLDI
jgi:hypothetical protein